MLAFLSIQVLTVAILFGSKVEKIGTIQKQHLVERESDMLANGLTKARSRFVALHARCNSIVWLECTCKALKIDDVIMKHLFIK